MTTPGPDWVEQARRVVEGVIGSAAEGLRHVADGGEPPTGPGAATDPATDADAATGQPTAGSDCRWCPLCQAAAVLRGERPDLTAALADILTATAAALRQIGGVPQPDGTAAPADAPADPEPPGDGEPAPPVVQRIELA